MNKGRVRGQLVVDKVHGPDMVGMGRFRAVGPQLRLDPTLGHVIAELQVPRGPCASYGLDQELV